MQHVGCNAAALLTTTIIITMMAPLSLYAAPLLPSSSHVASWLLDTSNMSPTLNTLIAHDPSFAKMRHDEDVRIVNNTYACHDGILTINNIAMGQYNWTHCALQAFDLIIAVFEPGLNQQKVLYIPLRLNH